jgi:hypothetical protein
VSAGSLYIRQKDWAPIYTSMMIKNWCRENLPFPWEKEI